MVSMIVTSYAHLGLIVEHFTLIKNGPSRNNMLND